MIEKLTKTTLDEQGEIETLMADPGAMIDKINEIIDYLNNHRHNVLASRNFSLNANEPDTTPPLEEHQDNG